MARPPPAPGEEPDPVALQAELASFLARRLGGDDEPLDLEPSPPPEFFQRHRPLEGRHNSEEDLVELTCDEAFTAWLLELEPRVGRAEFHELLVFVGYFRKALCEQFGAEFTENGLVKDIIDISNELCTRYFPMYREEEETPGRLQLEEEDGVVLVKAFFDWLFAKKYSNHRLSLH